MAYNSAIHPSIASKQTFLNSRRGMLSHNMQSVGVGQFTSTHGDPFKDCMDSYAFCHTWASNSECLCIYILLRVPDDCWLSISCLVHTSLPCCDPTIADVFREYNYEKRSSNMMFAISIPFMLFTSGSHNDWHARQFAFHYIIHIPNYNIFTWHDM